MNKSKGFTIIELLVVVAIIAVLAAIVLVNVTGYINQGKNAAIKGNAASILTNAAVVYDANGNYTDFCSTTVNPGLTYYKPARDAIAAAFGAGSTQNCTVNGTDTAWCACAQLKVTSTETATSYFCVDSLGTKKVYTGQAAAYCPTACPAAGACLQ